MLVVGDTLKGIHGLKIFLNCLKCYLKNRLLHVYDMSKYHILKKYINHKKT